MCVDVFFFPSSFPFGQIRLESEDEGVPPTAIREISVLKELTQRNIVQLFEVVQRGDRIYLVFEVCGNGGRERELKKNNL